MKHKILSILMVLLSAMTVQAQEITNYRGAFAPSPEPQWTDNWTNWDPQNAAYGNPTVTVSTSITSNTTWTSNNVYLLQGLIYVESGATLTIQAGTIIRGDHTIANTSLVIARGGKIQALGTACNPIVFTSNRAGGTRVKGDWGGIIMLGKAKNNQGTNVQIEGTSAGDTRNFHGGTDDNDNSGTLKYVRIEFGGYVFAANNEINGLTMGSIGKATTIDYVQVSFGNDDAFEWFGGNVNCKHLVAYRNLDDDFDTDFGFSGTVQYCLGIKDPSISDDPAVSTSEGFESDNDAAGSTLTPKTSAKFYNVTQIGAFRCAGNSSTAFTQPSANGFRRAARIRRRSELKIFNSILMNNWRGLLVDANTLANDQQGFQNNIVGLDTTTVFTSPYTGVGLSGEDAGSKSFLFNAAFNNTIIGPTATCDLLLNPWTFTNPDFRPNTTSAGTLVTTAGTTSGANLTAIVEIDNSLFSANQATEFLVDPFEQGSGATSGTITITVQKPSGWNITVPGITLSATAVSGVNGTSNVSGGTANNNGNWNFRDDGVNVIATSKPGVTIAINGFAQIGFTATRKGTTATGTNQNLGVFISGGGDTTSADNVAVTQFSAN